VRNMASGALWLAGTLGAVFIALGVLAGPQALAFIGGEGEVAARAAVYLQIGVFGLPFALIALAGQGVLRGVEDLKTPLYFIAGGNALNVVLEVLFVYGFGWGLAGSASATVLAQAVMGAGFIVKLVRLTGGAGLPTLASMRPLLRMSSQIFVRTGALYGSFLVMSAALAHVGPASLGAHQVLFQLWWFLALALDSIAIAGQVLVSRALGANDGPGAVAAANRMIAWSVLIGFGFAAGMLALAGPLPQVFTADAEVLERIQAAWVIFALMQPLNGAVFAMDGILIGAGDSRFMMWATLAAACIAIPLTGVSYALGAGIEGVWLAISALIVVRLAAMSARYAGRRWVVTGAASAR